MASATRLANEVYLIGPTNLNSLITLKQLPTVQQVLQRFHHHLRGIKSVRNASHITNEEVMVVWQKAGIPTILVTHAVEKLEKIHIKWLLLKKNKLRSSESQRKRELMFKNDLVTLYDIAHANALNLIKIKEDCDFLMDQRSIRKIYIGSEDKELKKKQERILERNKKEEERKRNAINKVLAPAPAASTSAIDSMTDSEDSVSQSSSDEDFLDNKNKKHDQKSNVEKIKSTSMSTAQIFTPHVTAALDRNKISDREALRLIVPVAAALGHDPCTLPLSRSTIQRSRKKARKEYVQSAMTEFKHDYPLVIHWDGKLLPESFGLGKVERLPVYVSGDGTEKLLGVPKLSGGGTGKNIAKSVFTLIKQWSVEKGIQALSFDTTSVNTGCLRGACINLEKYIGHELLWLACRHHIMELILGKVFTLCFGPSGSPEIPLFNRFRNVWQGIELMNFQGMELEEGVEEFKSSTIDSLISVDKCLIIRDDYKELIELTLTLLGNPPEKIHWRVPGAIHQARWMAKLLYAFKMFLFREQQDVFHTTKKEQIQLRRFVQFSALLYSKTWIEAPVAVEAPGNDLKLWKDLKKYEVIDSEVAIVARKVFENHLWYLSDELVGLALFSDKVSAKEKGQILAGMKNTKGSRNVRGPGQLNILKDNASLGDFATERTAEIFSRFNINNSFLTLSPEEWKTNNSYRIGQKKVKELRVVNDTAERGVQLIQDFNKVLTNDEDDKQFLLQVVEANRKAVPLETTKQSIIDSLSNTKV